MWEESPEGVASMRLKGAPPAKFGSIKTPRGVPGPVGDAGRRQRQQPTWKVLLLQSSAYKGPGGLHKPGALPTASGLLVEGEEIDPSRGEGWDALPPVFWLAWKKFPGHDPQQEDRIQERTLQGLPQWSSGGGWWWFSC